MIFLVSLFYTSFSPTLLCTRVLHSLCYHRDKLPKDTAEYSKDDNIDSHKCDNSTGQQSVKCDCLLDDEESDTEHSSSEKHVEQNQTTDHEQMLVENNQGNEFKC